MSPYLETIRRDGGPAPFQYAISETGVLAPMTVVATFDGTAASGTFRPALAIYAQNGQRLARVFPDEAITAGESAEVTYGVGLDSSATSEAGGTPLNVNVSGAGATTLVAATAGKRVRLVQAALMSAGVTAITFRSNATDLAGPYNLAAATGFVLPKAPLDYWAQTAVGEALVLNNSLAIQVAGVIAYELV